MNSRLVLLTFLDGGAHPDQGLPGVPGYPDQGLPGGPVHPWLPGHIGGGPRPDQGLPGGRPPMAGHLPAPPPVTPDNTLPTPPPGEPVQLPVFPPADNKPVDPKQRYELKYSPLYGWVLVPVKDGAQPK